MNFLKKRFGNERPNPAAKDIEKVITSSQETDDRIKQDLNQDDEMPESQDSAGQEDGIDEASMGDEFADDQDLDQPEQPEDGEEPQDLDQDPDQDPEQDPSLEDQDEGQPSEGGHIYIAGDGDAIGSQVGQAVLHDDEEALHEISHAINEGQQMVLEWAENNGGTVISAGGDEFVAILPEELYEQLEDLREAYSQIVGATLTIGVGSSMSEAGKALIYGKLNGKDQIAHYEPGVEEFLDQAHGSEPSEQDKMNEHYLNSLDPEGGEDSGANMATEPMETSEEEQINELPEETEIQKDEGSLRDKMLTVVESFRSEKDTIEASKDQNPELYQAFMNTLASMIDLARKMGPEAQAQQPEEQPAEEPAPDMSEQLQGDPEGNAQA